MRIYVLKRSLKDRTLHKGQFKWENQLPEEKKKLDEIRFLFGTTITKTDQNPALFR